MHHMSSACSCICMFSPSLLFLGSIQWHTGVSSITFPALLHPVCSTSYNPASSPQNMQRSRKLSREDTVLCWFLKVMWYVSVEHRTLHTNRKMKIFGKHCISAALDAMEHEVGLSSHFYCSSRFSQLTVIPHKRPLDILYI